jgi:glycosyltransferase involved in cell wall biosynthesis
MHKARKLPAYSRKAIQIWRERGATTVLIVGLQKLQKRQQKLTTTTAKKIKFLFLVKQKDVLMANWSTHPYIPLTSKKKPPYTINWVMSPPRSGGGHQTIYRIIHYLEQHGHTCRVYLYSSHDYPTVSELREGMKGSYPNTKASMEWLDGPMEEADAIFATGWETAYPVFNDKGKARKFYFVLDFEPGFYPVGTEYILAENTYKFNFFGTTGGNWLSNKLSREYGMQCAPFEFGADKELYKFTNSKKRKEIFFYARPVTARRGFELGVLALQIFHEKMPDYKIVMAGWDVSDYAIPFPYENLKTMTLGELSDVYNRSAAALVISLTNLSLMPVELLACGTIPVVTDGPNNREVNNNQYIKYADPSPDALAQALVEIVSMKNLPDYAEKAAKSVELLDWDISGKQFTEILTEQLNG